MNTMENHIKKMNNTSDNIKYLVDNKKICVNVKIARMNSQKRKMGFINNVQINQKNHSA